MIILALSRNMNEKIECIQDIAVKHNMKEKMSTVLAEFGLIQTSK